MLINTFIPNIPQCVHSNERQATKFLTVDTLLDIPFVKRFKKDRNFYRYSVNGKEIVAEFYGGREFWIIGKTEEELPKKSLPIWKLYKYE